MPKLINEKKLFNVAIKILIKQGYEGATTKMIASLAKVNEVTLFRRYGNKAALFAKAIEYQLSNTPLGKNRYTGDLEADLVSIVKAYIETNETHGDIVLIILLELPRNPDLKASLNAPLTNIYGISKIIQEYQKQGILLNESPIDLIAALIGPVMLNLMFGRANLNLPSTPIEPHAHVDAFLNGRKLK